MGSSTTLDPSTPTDPNEFNFAIVPHLNETIADSLMKPNEIYGGFTIVDTFAGQLFLETVNRTDTNFTFFHVGVTALVAEAVGPSTVGFYLSESWIGHIVSMNVAVTYQLDIAHVCGIEPIRDYQHHMANLPPLMSRS
jgi:hypothetical protein